MSHRLYHTEGFILQYRPRSEDSKMLYLFTPDFGLIVVVAQGVRKETSKLRANITDFSYGHYSLVRGREFWRLVSAEKSNDFFGSLSSVEKRAIVGHIFRLLLILIEEEESREIFTELKEVFSWLAKLKDRDLILAVEKMAVLRLLHHLGYLKSDRQLDRFVSEKNWSVTDLTLLAEPKTSHYVVQYLNKTLKELHW